MASNEKFGSGGGAHGCGFGIEGAVSGGSRRPPTPPIEGLALSQDIILLGGPGDGGAAAALGVQPMAGGASNDNILGGAKRLAYMARPASRIFSMEFGY